MELLKLASAWAKAEVFSSKFFILFGVLFLLSSYGFWQLGKTDLAKAFISPLCICGILLLLIGGGLTYTNLSREKEFPVAHKEDAAVFLQMEIARANKTIKEFELVVLTIIPAIIAVLSLVFIFFENPNARAISMSVMAMMIVILLIDTGAYTRMKAYKDQLTIIQK
ncbi:MAG: hypothetical protein ACON43_06190 [Flavobacteriaceae bacterium]